MFKIIPRNKISVIFTVPYISTYSTPFQMFDLWYFFKELISNLHVSVTFTHYHL